jgi:methyl-accepting chemotaxis protein
MSQNSFSLKQKLVSLVLAITLILGLMGFGIMNIVSKRVQYQQLQSFESYALSLSDAIGAQFYERYGDVQAFSISPAIQSSNRQTIIDALNTYSAMYGIYDLIMVVSKSGKLVAVNNKAPDGKPLEVGALYEKNYADEPWFKAVLSEEFTADKEKGFAGTYFEDVQMDPYTSAVYGEKRLGNSFSTAVKDSKGNVIGVITNRAGSRWFEVAVKDLFRGLKKLGVNTGEISLVGKDGTLLYEYFSDPQSPKLEDSKYDWEKILKFNLLKDQNEAIKRLQTQASGGGVIMHTRKKESFVTGFAKVSGPKFVDTIGWNVLVRQPENSKEGLSELFQLRNAYYLALAIVVALALLLAVRFSSTLSRKLMALADHLSKGAREVAKASNEVSTSSARLSEAATEQASAIQETASALDEVSAMLKSASDNAGQSQSTSQKSREFAEKGKSTIQEMIRAIQEINQSNDTIMNQVDHGNQQISEIVKMIEEIGQKTKVINDIVFQTKLLSFNASVEAARAGEHGKGFAVVAEEVGNLAQMSGNAAKEISSLLESSIQRVDQIINETKSTVNQHVLEGKRKVGQGTEIATRCHDLLEQILGSVKSVDSMVSQIAKASREQTQGVSEINKAMNQLDQVTQQNTTVAYQGASSASELQKEAQQLEAWVRDLNAMVSGRGSMSQPLQAAPPQAAPPQAASHEAAPARPTARKIKASQDQNEVKIANPVSTAPVEASAGPKIEAGTPESDDPRFVDL